MERFFDLGSPGMKLLKPCSWTVPNPRYLERSQSDRTGWNISQSFAPGTNCWMSPDVVVLSRLDRSVLANIEGATHSCKFESGSMGLLNWHFNAALHVVREKEFVRIHSNRLLSAYENSCTDSHMCFINLESGIVRLGFPRRAAGGFTIIWPSSGTAWTSGQVASAWCFTARPMARIGICGFFLKLVGTRLTDCWRIGIKIYASDWWWSYLQQEQVVQTNIKKPLDSSKFLQDSGTDGNRLLNFRKPILAGC